DEKDAVVFEGKVIEAPLALFGIEAVPDEWFHPHAERFRDGGSGVRAGGIHHDDFIEQFQRGEAARQVPFFVQRRDEDGNGNVTGHGARTGTDNPSPPRPARTRPATGPCRARRVSECWRAVPRRWRRRLRRDWPAS